MTDNNKHRSGFVAIIGKPNVGKSTLVNALIGHKISIVTSKPHTTRHAIMGVLTEADRQMVFIDTPGLENKSRRLLNRAMNRAAVGSLEGADVVLMVIEPGTWASGDNLALEIIERADIPCVLAVNKIDRIRRKDDLLPILQQSTEHYEFADVVPISAKSKNNLERLKDVLTSHLPEREALYAKDMATDRGLRFRAAEILREKLMETLRQEVPYGLGVEISELSEETDGRLVIAANIWVDRESHKGIVVGKGGQQIKRMGQAARLDMQASFDRKVHLESFVKVKSNWADNARSISELGYNDEA